MLKIPETLSYDDVLLVPSYSEVLECAEEDDKSGISVKYSGDITKALAAGAHTVMLGNMLAGLKEAPGNEIIYEGRIFKSYRRMGSIGAIQSGSGDRYQMKKEEDPVPEGIEGKSPT